jgi:hypothetical protein
MSVDTKRIVPSLALDLDRIPLTVFPLQNLGNLVAGIVQIMGCLCRGQNMVDAFAVAHEVDGLVQIALETFIEPGNEES